MKEEQIIEINNFTLFYDGMFRIAFNYAGKSYKKPIYLNPIDLLQMIENEPILKNDLEGIHFDGVKIKNTTLMLKAFIEDEEVKGFMTSDYGEDYQDQGYYLLDCEVKR